MTRLSASARSRPRPGSSSRWLLWMPAVMVGALFYWTVALGLGGRKLNCCTKLHCASGHEYFLQNQAGAGSWDYEGDAGNRSALINLPNRGSVLRQSSSGSPMVMMRMTRLENAVSRESNAESLWPSPA